MLRNYKYFSVALLICILSFLGYNTLLTKLHQVPLFKRLFTTPSSSFSTIRTMSTTTQTPLKLTLRKSLDRGIADHGWLKSFHTFSFADYYEPQHSQHGPLRVINEDRIAPGTGFGKHPHREFEIFTYIISGYVKHDDSMGNSERLGRGEIQMTSAGTGIRHAEYNGSEREEAHFCQIWVKPNKPGLTPRYATGHFPDQVKQNVLKRVVAPAEDVADGAVPIHANAVMYASLLDPGKQVSHTQKRQFGYLHHIMSSGWTAPKSGASQLKVNGHVLAEGDGLYLERPAHGEAASLVIESTGEQRAEFLLFDMDN